MSRSLTVASPFEAVSSDPRIARAIRRMPALAGAPVRVEFVRGLRDRRGPVHGGSFLRERRIALDCTRAELPRIFVHEAAHFIWLRLGNPRRLSYEALLRGEIAQNAGGELGWSAEWRKNALSAEELLDRSRRWREYCCESFCDTSAWLYSGMSRHPEFTLATRWRNRRKLWFSRTVGGRTLRI